MNIRQRLTVIAVDIAILAELAYGMHAASLDPDNFTSAFCKAFFSLLLPTLALGITAVRCLRDKSGDTQPTTQTQDAV
ncbi:hypothetical protein NNJEOMEG_01928 [Fundidesulfovibrio magnetotacticus]|uniref:Uncharacterized protein n=1 Tax=Fundidesulfovibrio magnetotacticus TaxID=2730080 RepID=A0A6V8LVG3_9BACT|nr:hypothetical protein [Fundidesulfovibrio magnetotacticus]GFK94089.1 hypothetical protein NNJEOMEG_01928 [Fundidesulfovibrio magnetotacticus]